MTAFGTLSGGSMSDAFAINLSGQVAGFSGSSSGDRAVIFSSGTIKNLGALSGATFTAGMGSTTRAQLSAIRSPAGKTARSFIPTAR
jgi:probable HAF family extracellular repeat protein